MTIEGKAGIDAARKRSNSLPGLGYGRQLKLRVGTDLY
jgi:hypothetical protein